MDPTAGSPDGRTPGAPVLPPVTPTLPPAAPLSTPASPAPAPRTPGARNPMVSPSDAITPPAATTAALRRRRRRRRSWIGRLAWTCVLVALLGGIGFGIWKAVLSHEWDPYASMSESDRIAALVDQATDSGQRADAAPAPMIREVGSIAGGETAHQEGDIWFVTPADAVRSVSNLGTVKYSSKGHGVTVLIFAIDPISEQDTEEHVRQDADVFDSWLGAVHTSPKRVDATRPAYTTHFTRPDGGEADARFLYGGSTSLVVVFGKPSAQGGEPSPADVAWQSLTVDGTPAITG